MILIYNKIIYSLNKIKVQLFTKPWAFICNYKILETSKIFLSKGTNKLWYIDLIDC